MNSSGHLRIQTVINTSKKNGITLVKYGSIKFILLCLSSKFIITNTRDLTYIPFSANQRIINTWHGGGAYKQVGSSKATQTIAEKYRQYIALKTPVTYLSSSKIFTDLTIHRSFHHNGMILNCGMPRNDLLFQKGNPRIKEKICQKYQIPQDNRLLLYAPTYRESRKPSDYSFDTARISDVLSKRFGGTWTVLFRMHYYIAEQFAGKSADYINVSEYPDMQELLYASDVLITDYSSSIWDYSFMGRPCFLYATDLTEYDLTQGFYTDIHTWPFALSQNNQELIENILNFDDHLYQQKLLDHHKDFGSYETGTASSQVLEYIKTQS